MLLVANHPFAQPAELPPPARVSLLGIDVDAVDMRQTIDTILTWLASPRDRCRYVVTPNVDHLVLLQQHLGLRQAYSAADLVLADGWPVVWASRILGTPLPERVPGSDLVPLLFAAQRPMSVFLLGAAPGVAERAAARIHARWPNVRVVGTHSPPLGFEASVPENQQILARLQAARPDLLVVGLGAPKQEVWVHAHAAEIPAKVALCVGGTIDFLAGHRRRAPRWIQRCGLEWLFRVICEPRRLAARYARDAMIFPRLVGHAWRQGRRS